MQSRNLEDAVRLAHGGLDVQSLDVLPVLLEEGHKEVDRNHDVGVHLVVRHLDVRSGDTEGQHLLELELDSGTDAVNLLDDVLTVLEQGRELTELVHGMPAALAASTCLASPRMQHERRGRGTFGSLIEPANACPSACRSSSAQPGARWSR